MALLITQIRAALTFLCHFDAILYQFLALTAPLMRGFQLAPNKIQGNFQISIFSQIKQKKLPQNDKILLKSFKCSKPSNKKSPNVTISLFFSPNRRRDNLHWPEVLNITTQIEFLRFTLCVLSVQKFLKNEMDLDGMIDCFMKMREFIKHEGLFGRLLLITVFLLYEKKCGFAWFNGGAFHE